MAKKDHVKILRRGVRGWNNWRAENPYINPNLIGANLSYADFSEANLIRTNNGSRKPELHEPELL